MTEEKLVACNNCRHCANAWQNRMDICKAPGAERESWFDAYDGTYHEKHVLCKDVNKDGTCKLWEEIQPEPLEKTLLINRICTTWTVVKWMNYTLMAVSLVLLCRSLGRTDIVMLLCMGGVLVTVLAGVLIEFALRGAAKKKGVMVG